MKKLGESETESFGAIIGSFIVDSVGAVRNQLCLFNVILGGVCTAFALVLLGILWASYVFAHKASPWLWVPGIVIFLVDLIVLFMLSCYFVRWFWRKGGGWWQKRRARIEEEARRIDHGTITEYD